MMITNAFFDQIRGSSGGRHGMRWSPGGVQEPIGQKKARHAAIFIAWRPR
jgi:hypothetical protein